MLIRSINLKFFFNRFFEVNLYQKDPVNRHHWRANIARPAAEIDLSQRWRHDEAKDKPEPEKNTSTGATTIAVQNDTEKKEAPLPEEGKKPMTPPTVTDSTTLRTDPPASASASASASAKDCLHLLFNRFRSELTSDLVSLVLLDVMNSRLEANIDMDISAAWKRLLTPLQISTFIHDCGPATYGPVSKALLVSELRPLAEAAVKVYPTRLMTSRDALVGILVIMLNLELKTLERWPERSTEHAGLLKKSLHFARNGPLPVTEVPEDVGPIAMLESLGSSSQQRRRQQQEIDQPEIREKEEEKEKEKDDQETNRILSMSDGVRTDSPSPDFEDDYDYPDYRDDGSYYHSSPSPRDYAACTLECGYCEHCDDWLILCQSETPAGIFFTLCRPYVRAVCRSFLRYTKLYSILH